MISAIFAVIGAGLLIWSRLQKEEENLAPVYDLSSYRAEKSRRPVALKKAA